MPAAGKVFANLLEDFMSRRSVAAVLFSVVLFAAAPHIALAQRGLRAEGQRQGGEAAILNEVFNDMGGLFQGMNQGGNNQGPRNYPSNRYPSNRYPSNRYPWNGYDNDYNNGYYNNNNNGYYPQNNGYYPQNNNYYPPSGYNVQPAIPYPNTVPAVKPAAPVKPRPNALPKPPALAPVKNVVHGLTSHGLTTSDIHDWHDQAADKVNDDVNVLQGFLPNNTQQTILLNTAGLGPADVAKAKDLIAQGDADGLKQLFQDNNVAAQNADPLLQIAAAQSALNGLKDKAQQGDATNADVAQTVAALQPFVAPGGTQQADSAISDILISSKLIDALNHAHPGNNPIPGGGALVFVVPGLAQGLVYPLGNGAVLAGGNLPDDSGISVFQGGVAQATGLSVGAGGPLPPASGAGIASDVLLTNDGATAVNYTVNEQHFSLPPGYNQALPDGTTWTVAFDKGAGAGETRYSLAAGTYAFTVKEKGWELYKKTYKVSLDNSGNSQDFSYVVGGKPQTLAAGQAQELTANYPIVVRFDDGAGQTIARRLETGTVNVALTPDGNSLDLFAATNDGGQADPSADGDVQVSEAAPGRLNLFSKATGARTSGVQLFGNRKPAAAIKATSSGAN
jgi:hypothetical protein